MVYKCRQNNNANRGEKYVAPHPATVYAECVRSNDEIRRSHVLSPATGILSAIAVFRQLIVASFKPDIPRSSGSLAPLSALQLDRLRSVASRQIACKRSCGSRHDRNFNERQGIERADAEQQVFHESHEWGGHRFTENPHFSRKNRTRNGASHTQLYWRQLWGSDFRNSVKSDLFWSDKPRFIQLS